MLLGENHITVSHDLRNLALTALSEDDDPATTDGFDRWLFRDTTSRGFVLKLTGSGISVSELSIDAIADRGGGGRGGGRLRRPLRERSGRARRQLGPLEDARLHRGLEHRRGAERRRRGKLVGQHRRHDRRGVRRHRNQPRVVRRASRSASPSPPTGSATARRAPTRPRSRRRSRTRASTPTATSPSPRRRTRASAPSSSPPRWRSRRAAAARSAASGAGTQATNRIAITVHATIDGDGDTGIHADHIARACHRPVVDQVRRRRRLARPHRRPRRRRGVDRGDARREHDRQRHLGVDRERHRQRGHAQARLRRRASPSTPTRPPRSSRWRSPPRSRWRSASAAPSAGAGTSSRNTIASKVNASVEGASGLTSAYGIHIHADNTSDLTSLDRRGGPRRRARRLRRSGDPQQQHARGHGHGRDRLLAERGRHRRRRDGRGQLEADMRTVAVTVAVAAGIGAAASSSSPPRRTSRAT